MTLIAWNGGPILKDGAIGTGSECCCGSPPNVTECCGSVPRSTVTVASSLSVTLTLGVRIPSVSPTSCNKADADAIVAGTYVVPYAYSIAGTAAVYQLVTASGVSISIGWYCRGYSIFGTSASMDMTVTYCNISSSNCYQRMSQVFWFDAPGFTAFGSSAPTLCSIAQGSTTPITGLTNNPGNDFLFADSGLGACDQNNNFTNDRYNVDISIVPSW
jgi:hypothetical protein